MSSYGTQEPLTLDADVWRRVLKDLQRQYEAQDRALLRLVESNQVVSACLVSLEASLEIEQTSVTYFVLDP
jgi:hypothetical protein